jgi:endoglucanase Acf2
MDALRGARLGERARQYHDGNNEESSSEDMNFSTGLILWGAAMGKKDLRDAGIFLYTTTLEAIEQYWFDADHAVFPKGFDFPCVGMVWSSGGKFDTWWDSNPIFIHGINYLPFQGGSLYLGRHRSWWRERRAHEADAPRGVHVARLRDHVPGALRR